MDHRTRRGDAASLAAALGRRRSVSPKTRRRRNDLRRRDRFPFGDRFPHHLRDRLHLAEHLGVLFR